MTSEGTSIVLGCIAFERAAEDTLARWLRDEALSRESAASLSLQRTLYIPIDDAGGHSSPAAVAAAAGSAGSNRVVACVTEGLCDAITNHLSDGVSSEKGSGGVAVMVLLIMAYWDGQSPESKASFAELKSLGDANGARHRLLVAAITERLSGAAGAAGTSAPHVALTVLVQALNAKKGDHTICANKAALVSSLSKKMATAALPHTGSSPVNASNASADSAADGGGAASSPAPGASSSSNAKGVTTDGEAAGGGAGKASAAAKDLSPGAVARAVEEGQGECFLLLSAGTRDGLEKQLAELRASCAAVSVACTPVIEEPREIASSGVGHGSSTSASTSPTASNCAGAASTSSSAAAATAAATTGGGSGGVVLAQEFLLRRCVPGEHLELRLAMCGNVDSGKSTLTSVLTRGCRDDGRGFARAFVFNHKHELTTGRTSSISENHLGFTATGEVVNYQLTGHGEPSASSAAAIARQYTPQELASRSAKVFTLYDLAGHEKYLKTTVLGMTRNMPDYACIVVSANNGVQRMTKEHLALCLALRLPFFVVVTRIDMTPENIYRETLESIRKLLKVPSVRKLAYPVRGGDDVILAARNLRLDRIAPIFEVSNVTGAGIAPLVRFLNLLPVRSDWRAARALPRRMVIDSTFFVTGVGTVVGGVVSQGVLHVNDTLLLGPDGTGAYRPVSIKSIHVKGVDVQSVAAGNDAAVCLKREKRSAIRKGNILADPQPPPRSYWQFEAEVTILYHSTTVAVDYEPVIHSVTVRQSARITYVAQEVMRTGDRSLVRFHFLYRPEFMAEGQRVIFREGRTKGIGTVTKLIEESNESLLRKTKRKQQ